MPNTPISAAATTRPPPHVSFGQFRDALEATRALATPERIEHIQPTGCSEVTARALFGTLRFFDCVGPTGHIQPPLFALATALDTHEWPAELRTLTLRHYEPSVIEGLVAPPGVLSARFGDRYRVRGDTLTKGTRFLITAALEARLPVADHLLENRKPRRHGSRRLDDPLPRRALTPPQSEPETMEEPPVEPVTIALPPLLASHLQMLPRDPKKGWPKAARLHWLRAFASNVMQVYAPSDPNDFRIELAEPDGGQAPRDGTAPDSPATRSR
jgi:hypothetical protein